VYDYPVEDLSLEVASYVGDMVFDDYREDEYEVFQGHSRMKIPVVKVFASPICETHPGSCECQTNV
jgi:hypothetical protein